jgi:2'-deoxynucleoside 5'-phosphate N-hydrolase
MENLKIYFAASIRGGRQKESFYRQLIQFLQTHGKVYTEHIGSNEQIEHEEVIYTDREIHDRDMNWLEESDLVIAEVTTPSLGVGYEIASAIRFNKPVLALFDKSSGNKLSAMIAGNDDMILIRYQSYKELIPLISQYLNQF